MRRLVNMLLITLILGVMAIVLALVWKIKQTPLISVAGLRPGETIAAVRAQEERVFLIVKGEGSERVIVLDARSLQPIGEIDGAPPPPDAR